MQSHARYVPNVTEDHKLRHQATLRGPVKLHDQEINYVPHFKYPGRMVTTKDSDMPALRYSIQQATVRWHQLARILRKHELKKPVKKHLIAVIIHSALLFGSETWVVDKLKLQLLRAFQQRILRSSFAIKGHVVDGIYHLPSREHVLRTTDSDDTNSLVSKAGVLHTDARTRRTRVTPKKVNRRI